MFRMLCRNYTFRSFIIFSRVFLLLNIVPGVPTQDSGINHAFETDVYIDSLSAAITVSSRNYREDVVYSSEMMCISLPSVLSRQSSLLLKRYSREDYTEDIP